MPGLNSALHQQGFTPYAARSTQSLIITVRFLREREEQIPTDLYEALHRRGLSVSDI